MTIYETENGYFSLNGNSKFSKGYKPTRLGEAKRKAIQEALNDSWVDKVYRKGGSGIYKMLLNGTEHKIA